MSAGLPSTGVGGALYVLLIVWMLLRELARAVNANGFELSRWAIVGKMSAILIVMVLVAIGEKFVIKGAIDWAVVLMPSLKKFATIPLDSFVVLMFSMPFILLLVVTACLHILRLWIRPAKTKVDGGVEATSKQVPVSTRAAVRARTL